MLRRDHQLTQAVRPNAPQRSLAWRRPRSNGCRRRSRRSRPRPT